jgi:hypothetical protein
LVGPALIVLTLSETYLDGALLFVGGLSIVRAE